MQPAAGRGSNTPTVAVVMVSHDSGTDLLCCVDDVLAQQGVALTLHVIDNASRDGSLAALPLDARLRVQRNADNPGFGPACNQGAAQARGEFLLFLNPDCRMPADTVARLCAHLRAAPRLAILGAALRNADGSAQAASRRATPRPGRAIRQALGLGGVDVPTTMPHVGALEPVEAVSGALMLLRRDTFARLGGFDPGYRLHCEDLDLCRRALDAGFDIALANDVAVIHHKGSSSQRRPVWVEWQKHRGMLRYFRKFDAAASPAWLRVAVSVGVWLRFPLAAARALWRARVTQR